jgi:predicted O-methyltransferase YrrM
MDSPVDQSHRRSKLTLLLNVLLRHPLECCDRMLTFAEFQLDRFQRPATSLPVSFNDFIQQLDPHLKTNIGSFLNEKPLQEIELQVSAGQKQVLSNPAFETWHDAEFMLARLCYAICRAQKPRIVVETGVGYGVTSAFLLQALAVNASGELWSIDLPPLGEGADAQSGCLIPQALRARWRLLRGRTRRMLPQLLSELPHIDLFLHDSLHTYRNMTWEFQTAWNKLKPGGVLISDDVAMNRAFEDFARYREVAFAVVTGEPSRYRNFGVMVKEK